MREGGGKGEGGEARGRRGTGGGWSLKAASKASCSHTMAGQPPVILCRWQPSSYYTRCTTVERAASVRRRGARGEHNKTGAKGGERRRRRDVLGVNGRHDEGAGADGALAGGTVCDDPRRYVRPLSSQGGRRPARHGCRRGVAWRGVGVAWATHSATPDGRCRQRDGFKASAAVRPQRCNVKT